MRYTGEQKNSVFNAMPDGTAFKMHYLSHATGTPLRAVKEEGGTVFVYNRRGRVYGSRCTSEEFLRHCGAIIFLTPEEEDRAWHRRIKRATKCLESSGLWPEELKFFRELYKLSLSDKRAMHDLYWQIHSSSDTERETAWAPFYEKYPFAFRSKTDIKTGFIWEKSVVKLKSMYFGYDTKYKKAQILESIKAKKKLSFRCRTGYDVTFEYSPEHNMAWYSEEYMDCANGHYYIALDHSTALFCEDD